MLRFDPRIRKIRKRNVDTVVQFFVAINGQIDARYCGLGLQTTGDAGVAASTFFRRLVPVGFLDNLCVQVGISHEILVITHSGADKVSTPIAFGRDSAPR